MHALFRLTAMRTRRSVASLVAVFMALFCALGPATASADTEWTAGPSFGADTNMTVSPLVVGDAAGGITAAWGIDGSTSTRTTIVAQHIAADGTREPLQTVGYTQWPGTFAEPPAQPVTTVMNLVPTASGAVISWEDPAGDPNSRTLDFKFARISADGTVGQPVTVATGIAEASNTNTLTPELAANPAGDVLVSWYDDAASKSFVQRFLADGTAGPINELPDAEFSYAPLSVTMLADGTGRVAWRTRDQTLWVARIKTDGTIEREIILTTAGQKLEGPPLLAAGNGVAAITWAENTTANDPSSVNLRTARLPSTGTAAPTVHSLADGVAGNSNPLGIGTGASMIIKPDGTIVNAWGDLTYEAGGKNPSIKLRVATLGPNDADPVPVNIAGPDATPDGTSAAYPQLALRPDGAVVLAWNQIDNSSFSGPNTIEQAQRSFSVRGLTIGADGTVGPAKSPSLLHLVTYYGAIYPFAAATSGGRSMVAWAEAGGNGTVIRTAFETTVVPTPTPTPTVAPPVIAPPVATPTPVPAPAAPADVAPKLSSVTFSSASIVAGDKATFVLTSSAAGTVKIVISKPTSGRKVAGKCVAQTKKNTKKPKCTFDKAITTITQPHEAGRTSIVFNGQVGKKKLPVGTYKATITVTGSTGLVSPATVLTFKVKAKKASKK